MSSRPIFLRALCLLLSAAIVFPLSSYAQSAAAPAVPKAAPDLVAVLDLEAVDADKAQASAMTDRLREELLKGGQFVLVERAQMEAILNEQAFQQTGCTSSECAVQAGKVLGVRKLITDKVTKLDELHWLLTANLIEVETAQTLRAESVKYEGPFFEMLDTGIGQLVDKLAGLTPREAPVAATTPAAEPEKKSSSKWWWGWPGRRVQQVSRFHLGNVGLAI